MHTVSDTNFHSDEASSFCPKIKNKQILQNKCEQQILQDKCEQMLKM